MTLLAAALTIHLLAAGEPAARTTLSRPDGRSADQTKQVKAFILPDTAPGAPGQLYDLEADPGETKNLYFERLEIVKELKALLDQSKASGRSRPEPATQNPSK